MLSRRRADLIALGLLLILAIALFADLLVGGSARVIGDRGGDLPLQYYAWRDFAFRELAHGNLALWNPHIFSGAPFFGGMQGAQLYPPNWIFLLLPLTVAINWSVALHVFAMGAFMFFWMRQRRLAASASFFGGVLMMFGGAFYAHVFAGHLTQLCAMVWSPLIFCAIDRSFVDNSLRPALLGIVAVALQLLAGFPQYLFYTALMAGLYSALRLIGNWNTRRALTLLSIYPGGALLAAIQMLPAIQTTGETTRGLRLPFQFASMVAFPPENFLTLIAPNLLGEMAKYWGRWYLWETSLYIGVVALVLMLYAAFRGERRVTWPALVALLVSLLLALGLYTPLFSFLYHWVPGFDRFRAIAKFTFVAALFLSLLAATGLDRLLRQSRIDPRFVAAVFLGALSLGAAGWWTAHTFAWAHFMQASRDSGQSFLFPQLYENATFLSAAQHTAAQSLYLAAGIAFLLAAILFCTRWWPRARFGVVALGVAEMLFFAVHNRPAFDPAILRNADEEKFLAAHPGDYRILNVTNPNTAMLLAAHDIWGYDATVVRRYAEFMTWTQGGDPNEAMSYVKFTRFDPLLSILRERYAMTERGGTFDAAEAPAPPLPHLQLISRYRILPNRDAIFAALQKWDFDPAREVILESAPQPEPAAEQTDGRAEIIASSTDSLTIEADLTAPAILLITDAYTASWRAVSLPGSVQASYQLLPANYILRAVPLAAGHHRFRVEYAPRSVPIGACLSLVSLGAFLVLLFWDRRQRLSKNSQQPAIKEARGNA